MSMRIFSAILPACALLAACGSSDSNEAAADTGAPAPNMASNEAVEQRNAAAEEGKAACAIGNDTEFKSVCSLERSSDNEGVVLTLRQPEGGFHRLRIVKDGRGVIAADGSEEPKVSVVGGNEIEVAFDKIRYRLPATVGAPKPPTS